MPRMSGDAQKEAVLDTNLVQALGEALAPAALSPELRASMRARVLARAAGAQPPLTETIRTESIPWRDVSTGVRAKLLRRDEASNLMVVLWRLEPGGILPGHPHADEEECLVLEGEMLVGDHCVRAGQLHIAKPGAIHGDLTTRTGTLVMVRSGISPLLTGLLGSSP
jgi:quercetin dioxygenase-like cupin family protein